MLIRTGEPNGELHHEEGILMYLMYLSYKRNLLPTELALVLV